MILHAKWLCVNLYTTRTSYPHLFPSFSPHSLYQPVDNYVTMVGAFMMNQDKLWQAALGQLELRVSQGNFLTWFRGTKIKEYKNGVVFIETPSVFAHEWLSRKYHGSILEVLQGLDGGVQQVRFGVGSQSKTFRTAKKNSRILAQKHPRLEQKSEEMRTERYYTAKADGIRQGGGTAVAVPPAAPVVVNPLTLNPKYVFDSFVIGPNNEVAHAACRAVASKPGIAYNPLFIYGGVGLGKTHLMHAIGNTVLSGNPRAQVVYVSSEKFTNEFVQALREHETQRFKDQYRNVDILMIDDVQFLAGKAKVQEELFHTFNTLFGQNKQIILSSDRSPKLISTFDERLKSRLAGGMLVDIKLPDYETRLAILEEKAQSLSIEFDQEALYFIAKNVQKNVRELEGALTRVAAHCELNKKAADLGYTQQVLEGILDKPHQRIVDANKIIEAVSQYFNLPNGELQGKSRKQEIVRPRQVAMYLLRKENNASFPSIGYLFGGRDHTTAMHACEKVEKMLEHNEDIAQDINFIRERIYA